MPLSASTTNLPLNRSTSPRNHPSATADAGVLSESRLANVANGGPAPSSNGAQPTVKTVNKGSAPKLSPQLSVRSIKQDYEDRENSTYLRPPSSASSRSSSPTASTSHQKGDAPHSYDGFAATKSNSYLLPVDPEATTTPPRPRTLSNGSNTSFSRSPSIRLASGSYPSTLRPPAKKSSNSSIRSLPEPPPPPPTQQVEKPSVAASRGNDSIETVVVMVPSVEDASTSTSASSQPPSDYAQQPAHNHQHGADADDEDAALYEDMDSVGDPSGPTANGASLSATSNVDVSKMSLAERREHSRRHSRVHSRNLSVFFPRPGTDAEAEADQAKVRDHFDQGASTSYASSEEQPGAHRRNNSGNRPQITVSTDTATLSPRSASFAALTGNNQGQLGASHPHDLAPSPTKSRRGHHHRHSVAMLDAGLSPVTMKHSGHGMERSTSSTSYTSDHSYASPSEVRDRHDSHDHAHTHSHRRSLHARTVSALGHIPQTSRPLLLFGISHFGLGAALWMAGQEVDSLSATGLGYLVVFDAMGILGNAVADWLVEWEQHASDLRRRTPKSDGTALKRPYGMHRVSTLLHFVQTIYLLFASVYVLKESVEHALLEGEGSGASGHDHSHAHAEKVGIEMPNLLLALSLAACVLSNMVMGNHAKLVAACGISTSTTGPPGGRHGRSGSVLMRPSQLASPFLALLANPFSLTVLFFASSLLFAGLTMHGIQIAALDKVLAGLESVAMFYVAYPASVALGKVLLQTAPRDSPHVQALHRALKGVEANPLVAYVHPPNVWQLTPPTTAHSQQDGVLTSSARSHGSKNAALVVGVTVVLREGAKDEDVLEMTRWTWERLAVSVGAGRGLSAGEGLRGSARAALRTYSIEHISQGFIMSNLLSAENLNGRLLFAIPKKGRLYEKCLEILAGADIQFKRAHRLDVALVQNLPIALVFLPAADIPRFVGEGNVDLGITGQDMVAEAGARVSSLISEELQLGFGKCSLSVQIPDPALPANKAKGLTNVEDLVGKKVATSFDYLAGKYFDELDAKVNATRGEGEEKVKTQIEYVGGSVEAACALGLADGIVDLVESGETMRACGLTALTDLLVSQAVLIKSSTPHPRSDTQLIGLITARIRGVIAASKYVLCQYNVQKKDLPQALEITPGRRAATVSPLEEKDWNAVSSMVKKAEVATIMDRLEAIGASDILIVGINNCRV
ncbi:ATP phosphoribosyltransferase, catalytic domain protein [Kalmanozyma brasiliensis GHG001]|uniref:ATP phosphoribosyltransferase, catalytic domain protein n=1 Tax=Kalmanozyma brasiliensis (strain GHG001) TaxID=1365824 RepID=UPI001CE9E497|nr:ATP phosphoribosyltransferase, catalytic domain protein [Kalmanozyma brasiliensis GHG001]EST07321.2 ATP phosphoribosyltransferase, catalytic domain protein [Kalmanozyma brasiliensis GHG001]